VSQFGDIPMNNCKMADLSWPEGSSAAIFRHNVFG
jgi:hypothetical protein